MDILTYGLLNKKVEEAKNVSGEKITEAVNTYLGENPPTTGATVEQSAQINKNTDDISELKDDLESVMSRSFNSLNATIGFNETIPENAMPSICDFTLTPTTLPVYYCTAYSKFLASNESGLYGSEIPIATTQGTLVVKDLNREEKYRKEIPEIINVQGVSDKVYSTKIIKNWSQKKYITEYNTKETITDSAYKLVNSLYTFEFTEDDFAETGIPLKADNIPVYSTGFWTTTKDIVETTKIGLWGGEIPRGVFYWDETEQKYYLKIRTPIYNGNPFLNTKFHFYYQLAKPVVDDTFYLALGLSIGDVVEFEYDSSAFDLFIENQVIYNSNSNVSSDLITSIDATPNLKISVPTSVVSTMEGFPVTATILNRGVVGYTGGGSSVDYSWIGDGDQTKDYTAIIQNKIDEIHRMYGKGIVYLGKGTYTISESLILYDNISMIGISAQETIIEQTADNTHAIMLNGSHIDVRDLSIKLSGTCTDITGGIYANSNNPPENMYCQHINIVNVNFSGKYYFDKDENGYNYVGDTYNNYKGCGIVSHDLYFNYLNCDNCRFENLYAGTYTRSGGGYFKIYCEACRYAVYEFGGYNTYNIMGHSCYTTDKDGNTISISDTAGYIVGECNIIYVMLYDEQWFKSAICFDGLSCNNKYSVMYGGLSWISNQWHINPQSSRLLTMISDLGRGNMAIAQFKDSPYHIGSRYKDLSGQTSLNPFNTIVNNALSGAGIWGNITSNIDWVEDDLNLKDVCRYPKERRLSSNTTSMSSIVSSIIPTEENPVEIMIDFSSRPVQSFENVIIQFDHRYVATDFVIYFNYENESVYRNKYDVVGNTDVLFYYMNHQNVVAQIKNIKIVITKALQIDSFSYQDSGYTKYTIDYNSNGLVGIVNIAMGSEEYCGRSFLGECGGDLYGDLSMKNGSYFQLGMVTELPEASESYRGKQVILQGVNGDKICTCLYNGAEYEWVMN